jgi:hypothetical protein
MRSRFARGMTERKARTRTGDSRFLVSLGMTISVGNCRRMATAEAKEEADSQRE